MVEILKFFKIEILKKILKEKHEISLFKGMYYI